MTDALELPEDDDYRRCSFCGKGINESQRFIRGPGRVRICDTCVGICNAELAARRAHAEGRPIKRHKRWSGARRRRRATVIVGSEVAAKRMREVYDDIVQLGKLPMAAINHNRHLSEHYCSQVEFVRELQGRASAVADFAMRTGLLSVEQWRQILREFSDEHPDA
jgi:hypothetical protein